MYHHIRVLSLPPEAKLAGGIFIKWFILGCLTKNVGLN